MKRYFLVMFAAAAIAGIGLWRLASDGADPPAGVSQTGSSSPAAPSEAVAARPKNGSTADTTTVTMADVLAKAEAALETMRSDLDDYTARFVKQERGPSGELEPVNEIALKVRTRFAGPSNQSPRRVYLRFNAPDDLAGREVIWGEDLYDGKMAVHEVGMLFQLKTIWLDPNGRLAMQGQRFPISDLGLVKLVEKLIERGRLDVDNPDVSIEITSDHTFDGRPAERIRVIRAKPSGQPDDFSLAEITVDDQRQWIVQYRAFGWATKDAVGPDVPSPDAATGASDRRESDDQRPLLESYGYYDLETNVGLTDADFDVKNPQYGFPRF